MKRLRRTERSVSRSLEALAGSGRAWQGPLVLLGMIRRAINMSTARHVASQYGDRVLRESKTLGVAVEVWSDVASSRGLGFRTSDAGPLLHGDLPSGVAFEMGVYARDEDGQYATLAAVRLPAALAGTVVVRPHEPWTRALAVVSGAPKGLPPSVTTVHAVRSRPPELASILFTPAVVALLETLGDRRPELHAREEEVALVLEGVELAHERVEAIVDALDSVAVALERRR
jgi:hypothetical protein